MIKTGVAYCRFSSDNQRQESIDAQLRAIRKFCKESNIYLKKIFIDEAQSGTTDKRNDFQKLISESKEGGWDYVIVHKLDRFARNRYDSAVYRRKLKEHGIKVLSVLEKLDDSPEAIILESMLEGMNEYYSANLAREVNKGMTENALKCTHNGGKPPLGYDVGPDKKYVINQHEAECVRKIFDMYCAGYGFNTIASILNNEGYKTKFNKKFSKNSIHDIIINEKYRGVYVWGKRLSKKTGNRVYKDDSQIIRVEGGLPRIVSDDVWYLAQSIKKTRLKPRMVVKRVYLLTGKLTCSECGYAYTGSMNTKGNGDKRIKYRTYVCGNHKKGLGCKNKSIDADKLEEAVLSSIKEVFLSDDNIDVMAKQIQEKLDEQLGTDNSVAIDDLTRQITRMKDKMNKLLDLYLDGNINQDILNAKSNGLDSDIKILEAELEKEKSKKNIVLDQNKIKKFLHHLRDTYLKNDEETKKQMVNFFIYNITIYPNSVKITMTCDKLVNISIHGGGEGNRTPVQKPSP